MAISTFSRFGLLFWGALATAMWKRSDNFFYSYSALIWTLFGGFWLRQPKNKRFAHNSSTTLEHSIKKEKKKSSNQNRCDGDLERLGCFKIICLLIRVLYVSQIWEDKVSMEGAIYVKGRSLKTPSGTGTLHFTGKTRRYKNQVIRADKVSRSMELLVEGIGRMESLFTNNDFH